MLPNGYLYLVQPPLDAQSWLANFLTDWTPVVVWAVILVGLLRSFVAARVDTAAEERVKARAIVENNGITALSYLTTWEGNSYWFSSDGGSFVAYRVEGGVAITTGDPIGPPEDLDRVVASSWRTAMPRAGRRAFTPTNAVREVTEAIGWPSLQKEGAEFVSLSGAPLAQANPVDEQVGVQKLLEVVGKTMEPVYGFRSLLKFKASSSRSTSRCSCAIRRRPCCPGSGWASPTRTCPT